MKAGIVTLQLLPNNRNIKTLPGIDKGHKPLMEASVNMDVRIVWQYAGSNTILLYNVDRHDRALP